MTITTNQANKLNKRDAPKSYVIIYAFLGNERLAIYGRFLLLVLRVSTQNTVTITTSSTLLDFIRYDGQRIRLTHPRVPLSYIMHKCNTWVSKSDSLQKHVGSVLKTQHLGASLLYFYVTIFYQSCFFTMVQKVHMYFYMLYAFFIVC